MFARSLYAALTLIILFGITISQTFAQDATTAGADEGVATVAVDDAVVNDSDADAVATGQTTVIEQIRNGGIPMGFLIVLAVVGIVLILERFMKLTRGNVSPDGLLDQAKARWREGDFASVQKLGEENPSALGKIIAFLAENRDAQYAALNDGAGEIAAREIQKHQQRNYWLAVVGTLSPLLGLLGTVLGMIAAFQAVAMAGDIGDVSMVADGIYKALSTTAAGLIIAIPMLGFYHFLKGRTNQLALELEDAGSHLIIQWFGKDAGKEG